MPEPPESLFESLTEAGQELVPVNLRLLPPGEPIAGVPARTAVSDFHHSRGYLCHDYHKPISRCLPTRHR
jgi:hypothetical protein